VGFSFLRNRSIINWYPLSSICGCRFPTESLHHQLVPALKHLWVSVSYRVAPSLIGTSSQFLTESLHHQLVPALKHVGVGFLQSHSIINIGTSSQTSVGVGFLQSRSIINWYQLSNICGCRFPTESLHHQFWYQLSNICGCQFATESFHHQLVPALKHLWASLLLQWSETDFLSSCILKLRGSASHMPHSPWLIKPGYG
jgi:hypothetical protein